MGLGQRACKEEKRKTANAISVIERIKLHIRDKAVKVILHTFSYSLQNAQLAGFDPLTINLPMPSPFPVYQSRRREVPNVLCVFGTEAKVQPLTWRKYHRCAAMFGISALVVTFVS